MTEIILPPPFDDLLELSKKILKSCSTKGKGQKFKDAYADLEHCTQLVDHWREEDGVLRCCEYCKRCTEDLELIGASDPQILICGDCSYDMHKEESDARDGSLADRTRSRR